MSHTCPEYCLQSVKTRYGMAIFTAECSHAFHLPYIASHVKNNRALISPVCVETWRDLPLLIYPSPCPFMNDVGARMNGGKLRSMKRAMHVFISAIGESDRMSIVAFSSTSKRLLPLKRMTVAGSCSVRRIVDAIRCTGRLAVVNDVLQKASDLFGNGMMMSHF